MDWINPLNAELNPICHLLALLGARHIFHFSRVSVNVAQNRDRWFAVADMVVHRLFSQNPGSVLTS